MFITASIKKKEKQEKQEQLINKVMWIPLIILIAIVPLIVKMVLIYPQDAVMDVLNSTRTGDAYSNYKSSAIIILCIAMAVIMFLCAEKSRIKWDKTIKIYCIGAAIFLGVSLIATLLSKNSHTAWWGMPDRAEGFVMHISYVFIILYAMYAIRNEQNYICIIGGLSFLIIINTFLGVFQFIGYDLGMNITFLKNFILGKECLELGMDLANDYESGNVIFGTMAHYNYMGSFAAMMVPFFLVLALFVKTLKKKIALIIVCVCSMFLLFGSSSRAGFIGLICSLIMMMIIFIKPIIKKWQITVPIIIALAMVLVGFNAITRGKIFSRIPTLVHESIALVSGSDEDFDYLDHIPVRGITYEDGKQKIEMQNHSLYIGCDENGLNFTDENGEEVIYDMSIGGDIMNDPVFQYVTTDERFLSYYFKMEKVANMDEEEAPKVFSLIYGDYKKGGMSTFYFLIDADNKIIMVDSCPIQEEKIDFPKTVGFKGKEKLGSARGYIWSRSIPLMQETLLWGKGPDTYALEFPQKDYLGKWWAYGTPNMIIDKAHSLYMGMWINNGAVALLGFMIAIVAYCVQSLRLFVGKDYYNTPQLLGVANFVAVIGYLGAGIFNDTVVSVTPIFCVLLGCGMGMNYYIKKAQA